MDGPHEVLVADVETRVNVGHDVASAVHVNGEGDRIGDRWNESLRPVSEHDVTLVIDHYTEAAANAQGQKPGVILFVLLVEDRERDGEQTTSRVHKLQNDELPVVPKLAEGGI